MLRTEKNIISFFLYLVGINKMRDAMKAAEEAEDLKIVDLMLLV